MIKEDETEAPLKVRIDPDKMEASHAKIPIFAGRRTELH